jgi:hypothetical protein
LNGPNKLECLLHYTGLQRLTMDKQSNLLGIFVTHKEN